MAKYNIIVKLDGKKDDGGVGRRTDLPTESRIGRTFIACSDSIRSGAAKAQRLNAKSGSRNRAKRRASVRLTRIVWKKTLEKGRERTKSKRTIIITFRIIIVTPLYDRGSFV